MQNGNTLLFFILIAAFPIFKTAAQWQQTTGPGGGFSTALYAKGDTLFTGNFENFTFYSIGPTLGTLYRSTDHGQLWFTDSIGFYGKPVSLTSTGSTVFSATLTDGIFRSSDNGNT